MLYYDWIISLTRDRSITRSFLASRSYYELGLTRRHEGKKRKTNQATSLPLPFGLSLQLVAHGRELKSQEIWWYSHHVVYTWEMTSGLFLPWNRPMRLLGDVSMSFYMIHYLVWGKSLCHPWYTQDLQDLLVLNFEHASGHFCIFFLHCVVIIPIHVRMQSVLLFLHESRNSSNFAVVSNYFTGIGNGSSFKLVSIHNSYLLLQSCYLSCFHAKKLNSTQDLLQSWYCFCIHAKMAQQILLSKSWPVYSESQNCILPDFYTGASKGLWLRWPVPPIVISLLTSLFLGWVSCSILLVFVMRGQCMRPQDKMRCLLLRCAFLQSLCLGRMTAKEGSKMDEAVNSEGKETDSRDSVWTESKPAIQSLNLVWTDSSMGSHEVSTPSGSMTFSMQNPTGHNSLFREACSEDALGQTSACIKGPSTFWGQWGWHWIRQRFDWHIGKADVHIPLFLWWAYKPSMFTSDVQLLFANTPPWDTRFQQRQRTQSLKDCMYLVKPMIWVMLNIRGLVQVCLCVFKYALCIHTHIL